MFKRSLILIVLLLVSVGAGYVGVAAETVAIQTSRNIGNLQLIYSSNEINEVPFFAFGNVVLESGDNRDDALLLLPLDGYEITPAVYRDPGRFNEIENPRPDGPEGKKIVFSAIGKNGKKGIYAIERFDIVGNGNGDKLKAAAVPVWVDDYNNWNPSLNSREAILTYVSDASGAPQIFIGNLKNRQSKQLTYLAKATSPFLDAKAEWIYFTGVDGNGNSDIYKIKTDGSALTRLTFSPEIEKYPTLTKYGQWIVYERGDKNTRAAWIMSLDGKIQKQISDPAHWVSAPCMNYAGTRIVFEGSIGGKKGIYLGEVSDDIFVGSTAKEFTSGINVEKEVVNLSQFGSFTPDQLAKLSKYGFFAVPTDQKQLFYTYEENEYKNIPSFVTADNLLQLMHIIFDTGLRKTEEKSLLPKLNQLAQAAVQEMENRKSLGNDPSYVALKRYFYTLYQLANNKPYPKIASSDQSAVTAELAKIKSEQWAESSIFPGNKFDYSLFKVRGHYSNSPALGRYFRAMSWIGLITFDTKTLDSRRRIALCAEILTANKTLRDAYQGIYRITSFYVGESDDPNFFQLADSWRQETKSGLSYASYDDSTMKRVLEKVFAQHKSKISTFYTQAKDKNKENRENVIGFMGQRYVADSHLFSKLFAGLGEHYLPNGLDLFAAMDNQMASGIIKNETDTFSKFPIHDQVLQDAQPIFASIGESPDAPLFNRWLRLLKVYANTDEKGMPSVLASSYWKRKKLNTSLASWAELKHDTILYGKQTGAECGGGDEPPKVYGYIEPEVTFYKALRQNLLDMDRDLKKLNAPGVHDLDQILELIDFFILVSDKELRQTPLSNQENEQIRIIGGLLEARTCTALDSQARWWEITSESAKNMAVVADIFSYWGQYQTEGVGYADDLYIIIPVNGQLTLMRGSIFSYYEFLNANRMTDSEWYEMLKTTKLEKRSKWWQPYLDGKKTEVPVPADPYDSGC